MTTVETWKPVREWNGLYEVSNGGRVRSIDRIVLYPNGVEQHFRSRVLRPAKTSKGYRVVMLHNQSRRKSVRVHSLVLDAFVGPRPEGMEVCHGPGGPGDNRLENLRWGTSSDNSLDQVADGTHGYASRDACKWGHLLEAPNVKAGPGNARICRSCRYAFGRKYRSRSEGFDFQAVADAYYAKIMGANALSKTFARRAVAAYEEFGRDAFRPEPSAEPEDDTS